MLSQQNTRTQQRKEIVQRLIEQIHIAITIIQRTHVPTLHQCHHKRKQTWSEYRQISNGPKRPDIKENPNHEVHRVHPGTLTTRRRRRRRTPQSNLPGDPPESRRLHKIVQPKDGSGTPAWQAMLKRYQNKDYQSMKGGGLSGSNSANNLKRHSTTSVYWRGVRERIGTNYTLTPNITHPRFTPSTTYEEAIKGNSHC